MIVFLWLWYYTLLIFTFKIFKTKYWMIDEVIVTFVIDYWLDSWSVWFVKCGENLVMSNDYLIKCL